jgi:hypothetical protein
MLAKIGLLLCTLALIAGACAIPFVHQERFDRKHAAIFDSTEIGSSKTDLEARAGLPTYKTDGTRWVEPQHEKSADQLVPGCVEEYWYHSWVVFIPSRWAYCFDKNGAIVGKYHWVSW